MIGESGDLVENVSEIAKGINLDGRLLASDEVCSEKTGVTPEKCVPKSPRKVLILEK